MFRKSKKSVENNKASEANPAESPVKPSANNSSRRSPAKPNAKNEVVQKKTQVLYRLHHAVEQRPLEPSRSTELVPLTKDFDDMRKQLRLVVTATKKYHGAMQELAKCRSDVIHKTAKLSVNSPLADAVGSPKVVLGESLVTLEGKLAKSSEASVHHYQDNVVDYVTEWETIVTKKIDSETKYTAKLQKRLKHYESKLEKLRKTMAAKEEKGKAVTPQQKEKLDRNEEKLKESWKEFEQTATKTCHLLEEATKMGWKDLHPLVKAMIAFEFKRDTDEHALWNLLGSVKDKVNAVVDKHDEPLPASALKGNPILTRPSGDSDLEESDDDE